MGGYGSGGHNKKTPKAKTLRGTLRQDRVKLENSFPDSSPPPNPPRGLIREARELWRMVCKNWQMDPAGLVVLRQVCETLGRLRQAQAALDGEKLTVANLRTGMSQAHPMLKVEKDTRETFIKLWRLLALDIEAPIGGK